MADRFLMWLGAGVLTAGITAATVAGAGVATAQEGAGPDSDGNTTSQSTDSADVQADSDNNGKPGAGTKPDDDADSVDQHATKDEAAGDEDENGAPADHAGDDEVVDEKVNGDVATNGKGAGARRNHDRAPTTEKTQDSGAVASVSDATVETPDDQINETPEERPDVEEAVDPLDDEDVVSDKGIVGVTPMTAVDTRDDAMPTSEPSAVESIFAAVSSAVTTLLNPFASNTTPDVPAAEPQLWTLAAAARREFETGFVSPTLVEDPVDTLTTSAAAPSLINVVGTLAWNVLDTLIKAVDFPPVMPADSSVTFGRSTLAIDCGDGYLADADWYFPKSGEPEKFIYFQHGFPARASFYDVTLRQLAERNNAIVVAPSITSNYFACDGCSLTADPMHEAVAELFDNDRAALLASARAAGFEGALPRKFVIAGQSAGSMLAAGAAGYYYDDPSISAEEKADMVGVVLYDGSAANGALARALDKLPSSVPVLHIAASPALINNFGDANKVFFQKRSGQFNGVQLIGGAHADAFQSSAFFGLVQTIVSIGFGASTPENVEAVQVLSQGWLTDMYAGRVYNEQTRTGIYGDPGQPGQTVIDIQTDAGPARGYVLPGPTPAPSSIEQFIAALLQSINSNDFITCSDEPAVATAAASCSANSQSQV